MLGHRHITSHHVLLLFCFFCFFYYCHFDNPQKNSGLPNKYACKLVTFLVYMIIYVYFQYLKRLMSS